MAKKSQTDKIVENLEQYQTTTLLDKDPRDSETKVLHVPLTTAEHREFKAQAGARDKSMTQFFREVWTVYQKHQGGNKS